MIARRLLTLSATLLLLASPALAQSTTATARAAAPTTPLDATLGLGDTSKSPVGFIPPTGDNLKDYLKAIGGVEITAEYQGQKGAMVSVPGAPPVVVNQNADVNFHASFSKKNGQDTATLDDITLTAKGVNSPLTMPIPLPGIVPSMTTLTVPVAIQKAEIHADGTMDLKLASWMPELHVKKIVKHSNGDIELKTSAGIITPLVPNITVKANGDVKLNGGIFLFHAVKKGHLDAGQLELVQNLANHWPPNLADVADIAAIFTSSKGLPPGANQLAGTLKWDVKANASGLPVTMDGAPLHTTENLELKGTAQLQNGTLATIGSDNTTKVTVDFAKDTYGDQNLGFTMGSGGATLNGSYKFEIPLDDPQHKAVIHFDGDAFYTGSANDIHMKLPQGGTVSIAQMDLTRDGALHLDVNGDKQTFQLDDAHYNFAVKGPIHVEKVGPISSLDLDADLSSNGMAKISQSGLLAIQGNLKGTLKAKSAGMISLYDAKIGAGVNTTVEPGTEMDLDLNQFAAAVKFPLDGQGGIAFQGADANGTIGLHANLGNTEVKANGIDLKAPSTTADLTVRGRASIRPDGITAGAQIQGKVALPQGGTLAMNGPGGMSVSTHLDPSTEFGLNANVTEQKEGGAALPELVVTTPSSGLNARSGPSLQSHVLKVLPARTPLKVLSRQGDWTYAQDADGSTYWVSTPYLRTTRPAQAATPATPVTIVNGRISGELGASGTTANLPANNLNAKLNDHLTAKVDVPFSAKIGGDGKPVVDPSMTHGTAQVKIDLNPGSQITFKGQTVTIQDAGCYAQFTGDFTVDASGKPVLQDLQNVDIELELGAASKLLLGGNISIASGTNAKLQLKGSATNTGAGWQLHVNSVAGLNGTIDIKL
jgi:hypothetical protein